MKKLLLILMISTLSLMASCSSKNDDSGNSQRGRGGYKEKDGSHRNQKAFSGERKSPEEFLFEHEELKITQNQKNEIKVISQKLKDQSREVRKEMRQDIRELDSIMVAEIFTEEKFSEITDRIEKRRSSLAINRRELFLATYRVLDENQREIFLPLFKEHISRGPHHLRQKHQKKHISGDYDNCEDDKQRRRKEKR